PLKNAAETGVYNLRSRAYSANERNDRNGVLQIDLIGKDLFTGNVKHTFNLGFDYRWTDLAIINSNSVVVDTVDVLQPISNTPPQVTLVNGDPVTSRDYAYGMLL